MVIGAGEEISSTIYPLPQILNTPLHSILSLFHNARQAGGRECDGGRKEEGSAGERSFGVG